MTARSPMSPITRWLAECGEELRRRPLMYVAAPPTENCVVCGYEIEAPGEAVHAHGRLAHVGCARDDATSMRGGA